MDVIRTGKRYCQLLMASRGMRGYLMALRAIIVHSVVRFRSTVTSQIVRLTARGYTFEVDLGRRELASVLEVLLENSYVVDDGWLARDCDTVLDVGANIGVYAILQAARSPRVRVYAFEPSPDTFRRLARNLGLNRLGNVEAHCMALSTACGTAQFLEAAVSLNSRIVMSKRDGRTVEVPVEKLDDFVATHGIERIDLLKIDTEGHELPILSAGTNALAITHRIVVETHGQVDEGPIQDLLKRAGFRLLMRRHDLWFFERIQLRTDVP